MESLPAKTMGEAYPRLKLNRNTRPREGSPEEATMASSEVRTGEEQGEATSAEEAPSRRARISRESPKPCKLPPKSIDGNCSLTRLRRLSPMTMDRAAATSAGSSVVIPVLSVTTEPNKAAERPNRDSTVANPRVYMATLLHCPDLSVAPLLREAMVSGTNDRAQGESAVISPAENSKQTEAGEGWLR